MRDIAIVAAVLTLVVSVNSDLLTAGETNEGSVRLTLNLVRMRIPPPVSVSIAAEDFFSATRNLYNVSPAILTLQDPLFGIYYWFRANSLHRMTPTCTNHHLQNTS